ncbi:hypothetical protein [Labilithrix luteola]|uniref:hypothetical protein n=1 Tax=Labilithrix luteola TaxID=1391654 RepID=UPI0011BAB9BE|nr:hypothetical protein [Labilithrix luteola]
MRRWFVPLLGSIVLLGCASSSGDAPRGSEDHGATEPAPASQSPVRTEPIADVDASFAPSLPSTSDPPLLQGDFEAPSAACDGWRGEGTHTLRSVPPHSGEYACRVCTTSDAPDSAIENRAGLVPAGRYQLTAWVRAHPTRPAPEGASATIEARTASGTRVVTAPIVVGTDYAQITVTIDLEAPADVLRVRVGALSPAKAEQCILVDDVVLERVR